MKSFPVPAPVEVDSYQASHVEMIPPGMERFQLSQGVFRKPLHYGGDETADLRIQFGGLEFIKLENGFSEPITDKCIKQSREFWGDYNLGSQHPWPEEMFERIVKEFKGFYPICIMSLRPGQAHYVGEPHMQAFTDVKGMGECIGWIESTVGPYLWTMSTVATRGRVRMDRLIKELKKVYPSKSRNDLRAMALTRFHDFGRRGGSISQMTGIAHLYNWLGSDTSDAAFAARFYLNNGKSFGAGSIPAGAHRSVTPWPKEDQAYDRLFSLTKKYKVIAEVADSYGYSQGIRKLAKYAEVVKANGSFFVGRPDSGDPVECVIEGLNVLAEAFGTYLQESGLKMIHNAGIIQGDGVSDRLWFEHIIPAVIAAGFCPMNVAIGMGEYNHRAVRSDMEWGWKTAEVGIEDKQFPSGYRSVMKGSNNLWKRSYPGPVGINYSRLTNRVYPITTQQLLAGEFGEWVIAYDGRSNPFPVAEYELFDYTRSRAWETWENLPSHVGDTVAPELRKMQEEYLKAMKE